MYIAAFPVKCFKIELDHADRRLICDELRSFVVSKSRFASYHFANVHEYDAPNVFLLSFLVDITTN